MTSIPSDFAVAAAAVPEGPEPVSSPALAALLAPELAPLFERPVRSGIESAWYGHVPFAQWLVAACRPRVLVELGTHNAVSYFAFCETLRQQRLDARAYAVDTWKGDEHAGLYGDDVYRGVKAINDQRYAAFSELLRCTFNDALDYFAPGSIDLLHIDGLHTYEAVRGDWEAWQPKLSDRAVVLFHDTNMRERGFGVWRLWEELRGSFPSFEFLHAHGLGVLATGPRTPAAVRALCALTDPQQVAVVRERLSMLGERWTESLERAGNVAAQQRAEAELAGRTQQLEQAQAALDRLGEELAGAGEQARAAADAARKEQDALRRLLDAQALELSALHEQHQAQLPRIAVAEAERARLGADLGVLLAAHQRDQAELGALRSQQNAIAASAVWRAAAPLRRAGEQFPGVTRQATRAARLGALAFSGRLPGRLRQRRRMRDDAALLAASPLFDAAFYLRRYPDVARAGADPLWHYLWSGAAADYDPHPLFSTGWYRNTHPEVAEGGHNPLAHYLRHGSAAGWDPHPLFDTAHYLAQAPEAGGQNVLVHYLAAGGPRDPNPLFRVDAYRDEYLRGTEAAEVEPLSHYVLEGAARGLDPHELFDTDWYARTWPDSAGWNPLGHYLRHGQALGHAPCPLLFEAGEQGRGPLRFAEVAAPDVSVIVPVYGHLFDTLRCLHALMLNTGDEVSYEVIVADDRPDAPLAPKLRGIPGLRVVANPRNLGFLRSCNNAAAGARGRHLVFLNNDTSVHPGWLAPLVRLPDDDPRVGMVGAKLLNADGTVQEAGGSIHSNGWGAPYGRGDDPERAEYNFVREVDVVIGACFLVPAHVWRAVGGFDDRFAPAYYEEFDLAFTLRSRGWRVLYQPLSRISHFDASSYGREQRDRQSLLNHELFCQKWEDQLLEQPAADAPPIVARQRPAPGGRILMIDDRVPEPDKHAGSVATFHWLRLMVEAGMAVTYAPHDGDRPEPYTGVLQQMGVEVLYGAVDKVDWIARNGAHLDHVWSARPDVTAPLLDVIERYAPGKLVYFTHDLHFLREQRRYALDGNPWSMVESRRLRRLETSIFRRAQRIVTASSDEAAAIREIVPDADVQVIPLYSVPSVPLAPAAPDRFAGRHTVVFVGGYAHPPNEDAALWLAQEIMPLVWKQVPEARLVLAGSKPTPAVQALASERISVPGWLPEIEPIYAVSRVSLSPLRYGAGVKGKIIAALQAGVPVVTTGIGNEGLGLADGRDVLLGDTAEALAAHAIALLRDPALCARLSAGGTAALQERFDEDGARRTLMAVLGRTLCPVCGHRGAATGILAAAQDCPSCGATETERSLAEAAIRPFRAHAVASLREAAPLLGRQVSLPAGPLGEAFGQTGPDDQAPPELLVTLDGSAVPPALPPGGRWIRPGTRDDSLAMLDDPGWRIRLHRAGVPVIEAERVGAGL